jgi:hypothetical protein
LVLRQRSQFIVRTLNVTIGGRHTHPLRASRLLTAPRYGSSAILLPSDIQVEQHWGEDQARERVPVAGDTEGPLPDARRDVPGRAEG